MATYWKSTGKWYCEICKCWTGDNKASIEFHERGKRHNENKRRKILEIKRDSIGKRKKDEKEGKMFAKMEKDALSAIQKDVAGGNVGRSDMKKIISAHSNEPRGPDTIDTYPWSAMTAPQGFTYYYNSATGESTWIVPEVFKKIEEQKRKKENEVHTTTKSSEKIEREENAEEKEEQVEQRHVHPLLGGWSTVKTVQSDHVKEEEKYLPVDTSSEVEVQVNADEGVQVNTEEKSEHAEAPRESGKKFKEKVMSTNLASTSSEPVAFKKRKSAQRNVRKRNDDD